MKKKIQTDDKKIPLYLLFETEKKENEKKSEVPHQSTVTATMLVQYKHIECIVPKYCSDIAAFLQSIYFQLWLVIILYFIILF